MFTRIIDRLCDFGRILQIKLYVFNFYRYLAKKKYQKVWKFILRLNFIHFSKFSNINKYTFEKILKDFLSMRSVNYDGKRLNFINWDVHLDQILKHLNHTT